jgi:hypothetical protein
MNIVGDYGKWFKFINENQHNSKFVCLFQKVTRAMSLQVATGCNLPNSLTKKVSNA